MIERISSDHGNLGAVAKWSGESVTALGTVHFCLPLPGPAVVMGRWSERMAGLTWPVLNLIADLGRGCEQSEGPEEKG